MIFGAFCFVLGIIACLGILRWSVGGPEKKYRIEH